jgi:segregation and condensation protein A
VSVGSFDGPLALLLALIEQRELDVRTVRLGELTAAYLEALATLSGDRLPHLSAFTAVAAQLILIKSRAILPEPPTAEPSAEEAADPAEELRRRLIVYRAFRDAGRVLAARMASMGTYHREPSDRAAATAAAAFPVGPAYEPAWLIEALRKTAEVAPPPEPPAEVVPRIVTLAERAAVIREALGRAPIVVLQELLRDVTDRVVMAVTFLALLELVKRREVAVEQSEPWGPIRCRRVQGAESA